MSKRLFNLQIELEIPVYAEDAESAERMAPRLLSEMDHLMDVYACAMSTAEVQSILDDSHDLSGGFVHHDGSRYTDVAAEDAARAHLATSEGETP